MNKSDYMENCDLKSTGSEKESIVQLLKSGTFYLLLNKYSKSISFFEKARDLYYQDLNLDEYISQDIDICVIDYALLKCYSSHKKYNHKREKLLTGVEEHGRAFPALFYEQALLMFDLRRFEEAENIIDTTLQIISVTNEFKLHYWPFSNTQIPECNLIILIDMFNSLKLQCQNQLDKQIKNSEILSDDSIYHSDHSSDKEHVSASTLTSSLLTKQEKYLINTDTNIISVAPKEKQIFKLDAPEFIPSSYCKGDFQRNSKTTLNMNYSNNITDKKQNYDNDDSTPPSQPQISASEMERNVDRNVGLILSRLTENQDLLNKIKALETDIKYERARSLQLERTYAEENKLKSLAEARLEVKIEEMQKTLTKYEDVIKKQEQKIKYLETSLTEQFSRFCSWQKQDVVRQVNKCVNVITDLKSVTTYLTSTSIPTVDMCRTNMSQWSEHLKNVKQYSEALDNYYSSVFNQMCNDEYPLRLNQPELFTDIFELRHILHDNYIPVINFFTNLPRPNFLPPPLGMPNNNSLWYGKCFPPSGAIVPRNYYNNRLEGPPLYATPAPLNQNVLPYPPMPSNADGNRFITEVSTKMINTQPSSKISEIELNASIEIPAQSIPSSLEVSETNGENVALTNTSKDLQSTLSSLTLTTDDVENAKIICDDLESNNGNVKESNTVDLSEPTVPSCSYADKENDLVNLNELVKNKETRQISDAAKAIGGPKFYNLFLYLKKKILNVGEEALLDALKNVRQKKIKLSGMTREDIVKAVLDELKGASETQEIVNKPAWGNIKTTFSNWQKDVSDNVCVICYDCYDTGSGTKLKCQHSFHSTCVRKWFATNSICPICRLHTTTDEDFPPLS